MTTTLKSLLKSYECDGNERSTFKNGHVMYLFFNHKCNKNFVSQLLMSHVNSKNDGKKLKMKNICTKITYLNKKITNLRKDIKFYLPIITNLLQQDFVIESFNRQKIIAINDPSLLPLKMRRIGLSNKENTNNPTNLSISENKNEHFKTVQNLKMKLQKYKKEVNDLKINFSVKRINQQLKRHSVLIKKYKSERSVLRSKVNILLIEKKKLIEENLKLNEKIDDIKQSFLQEKKSLKKEIKGLLKVQLKQAREIKKAKGELDNHKEKLAGTNVGIQAIDTTDNCKLPKQYDSHTRKCLYFALESQVPVERAGVIVNYIVKEFTNVPLIRTPAPSTIANMAYEMGIISELQIAEQLFLSSENVATIAWDATTIDGCHYNVINISLIDSTYTLEVGKLSGGKTQDYTTHIIESIQNMTHLFALFNTTDIDIVKQKIILMFQNTLSDRAPVNHCVSQELSKMLNKALLELHCSLHPLDGLAAVARKVLSKIDEIYAITSQIRGTEGKAANLMYAVSKLRYKNSGDPAGFKAFLRLSQVNITLIPRYVGNRLHVLFHTAGIIVKLEDPLCVFLDKFCTKKFLRLAILQDLRQPVIITQLRVLGLFGKLLTGSWMKKFYKNEQKLKHSDMGPVLKSSLESLRSIEQNPLSLLDSSVDCFGQDLDNEDDVLEALRKAGADDIFCEIGKALASGFIDVLERQLYIYLNGELSETTPDLSLRTLSAPLHNMHCERALGMFDAHCSRSKNATAGFMDGKIKFKINKSLEWLESKSSLEQNRIILFAVKHATNKRVFLKKRDETVQIAVAAHQKHLGNKRDKQKKKDMEKIIEKEKSLKSCPNLSPDIHSVCQSLLDNVASFVGRTLHHTWEINTIDEVLTGTIKKVNTNFVWIQYIGYEKVTKLPISALIVDIIWNEATFI